jgi:hypothetical protein
MRRIEGCCRFVFNQALAVQIQRRDQGKTALDLGELKLDPANNRILLPARLTALPQQSRCFGAGAERNCH